MGRKAKSGKQYKKDLVKIGLELGQLTDEDVAFMLAETTTEAEADRRMITCRKRQFEQERGEK